MSGTATMDGLKLEAAAPVVEISSTSVSDLASIHFTTSGNAVDSKITHQANTSLMTIDSGRNATWGGKIEFVTDTDRRMRISNNGDISFYDTDGSTVSFVYDASAGTTFNEAGLNRDFRVESNNSTHMLFVDGGNDRVGVNKSAPDSPLHVKRSAVSNSWSPYAGTTLTLEENSGNGNILQFMSDNAATGEVWFGDDDSRNAGRIRYEHANNKLEFWTDGSERLSINSTGAATFSSSVTTGGNTRINGELQVTAASGKDRFTIAPQAAGAGTFLISFNENSNGYEPVTFDFENLNLRTSGVSRLNITPNEIVANDLSTTQDFRVESDTNTHALFVNGENSRIGLSQSNPSYALHIGDGNQGERLHFETNGGGGSISATDVVNNSSFGFRLGHLTGTHHLETEVGGVFLYVGNTSGSIFNEVGAQHTDFRVESDSNTHMLFVDAGNDRVYVGGSTNVNTSALQVTGQAAQSAVVTKVVDNNYSLFQGFNASNALITQITGAGVLTHNGAATFNSSVTAVSGVFKNGADTSGTTIKVQDNANRGITITSPTSGAGSGIIGTTGTINGLKVGVRDYPDALSFVGSSGEVIFNDSSNDADFRVESNDSSHMLFVEAGTNRVGINNSDPSSVLHITGTYGDTGFIRMSGGAQEHYWYLEDALNSVFNIGTGSASAAFDFRTNNVSKFKIGAGEVVANESSADIDFRVESDNNTHMLFVDGGNDRVSIGDSVSNGLLTVVGGGTGSYNQLTLSNRTDANSGKIAGLTTLSYAGDNVSVFQSYNSSTLNTLYLGSADGSHRGFTGINTFLSSSTTATSNHRKITSAYYSAFIINDDSNDVDFRVESDSTTHAFFVQGNDGNVGINEPNPDAQLHILGKNATNGATIKLQEANNNTSDNLEQFYSVTT